jgi:hypothetical protein
MPSESFCSGNIKSWPVEAIFFPRIAICHSQTFSAPSPYTHIFPLTTK